MTVLLAPLLALFGEVYSIPQLLPLALGLNAAAIASLIALLPIGGALGCVGLALNGLTRLFAKRKRRPKRKRAQRNPARLALREAAVAREAGPEISRDWHSQGGKRTKIV